MKNIKRYISLILVTLLLFSTLSMALPINAEIIEGVGNYKVNWKLDTETGTIYFSGNGSISRFGEWNKYQNSIKKVIVGSDINKIWEGAFSYFTNLSEVEIPDTLTDIGFMAFYDTPFFNSLPVKNHQICLGDRLLGVEDFCGSITVNQDIKHICGGAFSDNVYITNITIPNGVVSIGDIAFEYCTVKNMVIPDSVTSIGYGAFRFCPYLKTVTLSKNITRIERDTFWGCNELESMVIPDGVTTIEYWAFCGCDNLESIYIPSSVSLIREDAFEECPKLTIKCYENSYAHQYAVEKGIPYQLLNSSVTEKGMQFKIDNLESVKTIRYAYGEYSTEKDIKYGVDSVSHSGKTLRNKGNSCTLQFPKAGLVSIVVTYNDGTKDFYKYEVIKSEPTVTRDGNEITFGNLDDLKVIRYAKGEYETSYDIKRAKGSVAISGKNLTSDTYTITLERETYTFCVQYNDESYNYYVTGICGDNLTWVYDMQSATLTISGEGEMYEYATKDFPWYDYKPEIRNLILNEGITTITQNAFCELVKITEVNFPSTLKTIEFTTFYNCKSLKSVIIPDSVIYIGSGAFSECRDLESVKIGNGIKIINIFTFQQCTSLTSITFPETLEKISSQAFSGCSSLENIQLPDKAINIESDCFIGTAFFTNPDNWEGNVLYLDYCLITGKNPQTSITVKNGTKYIGNYSLLEVYELQTVIIPQSVVFIGEYAISDDVIILCYENSYAHEYAKKHSCSFQLISEAN